MAELRLVVLGIGNAFSELYYSTALALVAADGQWLLIDCPHPIRKILREASRSSGVDLSLSKLAGVALTHLHADHASGLEGLGFYFKYILASPQQPTLLLGPNVLQAFLGRHEATLFNVVPVTDACLIGPFTIEARPVVHGDMPACAFRIACAGRSVGHSGDTRYDADAINWLAAADLVVHEAGAEAVPSRVHTAYSQLAGLPVSLQQKMRIIHCPDDFDLAASAIEPLRQGQVYEIT